MAILIPAHLSATSGEPPGRPAACCLAISRSGMPNLLAHIVDLLNAPCPLPALLAGTLLAAVAYCFLLFDPSFLAGTSSVWSNPRGIVGYSWADMPTALSGYFYFLRDGWRLPLFDAAGLGGVDGTSIIFTD